MKKNRIKWKIYFGLLILILPMVFVILVFLVPPQYDETYLGELHRKKMRLENITGEKIIIVGGSSVPFGIRSDLMEKQLGKSIVDWGLYVPLGSRMMLESCFDEIREGDIVVFSPEQNSEALSFSFQAENVWQAMDGDFSLLHVFQESEIKSMLGAFPEFGVSKLRYALKGKPKGSGIYQRESFNEYGDITAIGRDGNQMTEGYDTTQMIDFSYFPDEEFIKYLNEYSTRVQKKGARFFYRFGPMNELAVVNDNEVDAWFQQFNEAVEFTILGNPHTCIMESGWFYDTNFHLNAAGAIVNTYYFIRDIKAELKDATVTGIELPEMPISVAVGISDTDNSDSACFLYEETGENLVITGVNEKGKNKEELVLPNEHDNKRVIGIREKSLDMCTKLKSVYVYGGMTLYDGSFGGCKTLEKIILLGKPEEMIVGKELLRGSNALLYADYEEEYRQDYSWGLYSDKIRKYSGGD